MSGSFRLTRSVCPPILLLFLCCNGGSSSVAQDYLNSIHANSNAIPQNSTRNSQNDKLGDVFESYIISDQFCDDEPCKEEYRKAGYPYEQIMDALNKANIQEKMYEIRPYQRINLLIPRVGGQPTYEYTKSKKIFYNSNDRHGSTRVTFGHGFAASETLDYGVLHKSVEVAPPEPPKCKENKARVYPFRAKGIDGKDYFLTNVKTFQQRAEIIRCYNEGGTCGDVGLEPETYTHRCRQLHERVFISSFPVGQNITIDSHNLRTFLIPSGCVCEEIQRRVYLDNK